MLNMPVMHVALIIATLIFENDPEVAGSSCSAHLPEPLYMQMSTIPSHIALPHALACASKTP